VCIDYSNILCIDYSNIRKKFNTEKSDSSQQNIWTKKLTSTWKGITVKYSLKNLENEVEFKRLQTKSYSVVHRTDPHNASVFCSNKPAVLRKRTKLLRAVAA